MEISSFNNQLKSSMDTNLTKIQNSGINKNMDDKRLNEAARDFEAVYIQTALKSMRPSESTGLLNGGMAEEMFMQFMDEAIAKEIAKSENNFGIADRVIQDVKHSQ